MTRAKAEQYDALELSDEILQAIDDSCNECGHYPLWDCEHVEEPLNFEDES
jgi:hypothetical protein